MPQAGWIEGLVEPPMSTVGFPACIVVLLIRCECYKFPPKADKDPHAAPCRSIVAGTNLEDSAQAVAHPGRGRPDVTRSSARSRHQHPYRVQAVPQQGSPAERIGRANPLATERVPVRG